MNAIVQAFKHIQLFKNREKDQNISELVFAHDASISEDISRVNNQEKSQLTADAMPAVDYAYTKTPPPIMPNVNTQEQPQLPADEIAKAPPAIMPDINSQEKPQRPPGEIGKEPPPELPNIWIYDGEVYDLSDFIKRHPGGEFFIGRMKNRDITTLVNIFHPNPEKSKRVLKKYALGRKARPEDVHPKYNAPPFLFREGFDGWRDTPKFNFQNQEQLLNRIKTRINEPEMKKKIEQMDFIFDVVTIILLVVYILVQVLRLNFMQYMPIYLFVPLMAALRISLTGAGHYLIHRAQVRLNKVFANIFDISYVPMAFVVTDGHTLMHHPFTQSQVDIKRNVFTAMLELPRFYRIPVHTVHKLGHVLTGMFVRLIEICTLAFKFGVKDMYGSWQRGLPHYIGTFSMRIILVGELILFWMNGDFGAWLAQFILTLWISTFMIVASHDFEEEEVDPSEDWAVSQIRNSYDLTMIGNKYIDCFLSAGLSPHRVHHVLPYQKSGFANIISEDIVREEAEKFNVVWSKPKNFFFDRLPILVTHYLLGPSRSAKENNFGLLKEHFHPQQLMTSAKYVIQGFLGIGSI
ncbi:cytochrome b5 domain-containing protein [Nostoc sp. C052]|uniref:cytochrome b5 domain-containing protein n=1 Tax=Nostoc sp. C052 TaxID=2576902 RepID=UPI00211869C0|nr:cytochrome b5 domain-containing protein [Nostoc sp. C052]